MAKALSITLSYLHRFPVKTLKIDRSFIGRIGHNGENSEIVRTINTLANNLGMEVVAEGVETVEQLSQLKSLRCDFGQGYLFSGALNAEEAEAFIQSHQSFIPAALIEDGMIHAQLDLIN